MIGRIFLKIKYLMYVLYEYVYTIYLLHSKEKRILLMGIPCHGNIGDQAIVLGEEEVLNKLYPDKKIIKISYNTFNIVKRLHIPSFKLSDKDIICLHGGGNLGTLYLNEEIVRRYIIEKYYKNKIVVMPISIFFHNNNIGSIELYKSVEIYNKCKNLTILARDENSYKFGKQYFKNNIVLVPDVVTALEPNNLNNSKKYDVLLLLRKDKEKILNENTIEKIIAYLKKRKYKFIISDTIIDKFIYNDDIRNKVVLEKLKLISKSKIIITDRFHGVIFSVITSTPVIAFKSFDRKIEYGIKWFSDLSYIHYMQYGTNEIQNIIEFYINHNVNKNNSKKCKKILLKRIKAVLEDKHD